MTEHPSTKFVKLTLLCWLALALGAGFAGQPTAVSEGESAVIASVSSDQVSEKDFFGFGVEWEYGLVFLTTSPLKRKIANDWN